MKNAKIKTLSQVFNNTGGERGDTCEYLVTFPTTKGHPTKALVPPDVYLNEKKFEEFLQARGCDFEVAMKAMKCVRGNWFATLKAQACPKVKMKVPSLGWQSDGITFAAPTGLIGMGKDGYHLSWESLGASPVTSAGGMEAWKKGVRAAVTKSSPLMFVLGLCFAAPLVRFIGSSTNRLVILVGESSIGKTSLLQVAQSVFGNPAPEYIATFNMSDGGFGEWLAGQKDIPAIVDELATLANGRGEVQDKALASIYRISATSGRKRHSKAGYRDEPTRTLILTSYETVIHAQHIGQNVRMLNVPVDMGKGLGIFNKLSPLATGSKEMLDKLVGCALANHGLAGAHFIHRLTKHIDEVGLDAFTEELKSRIEAILQGFGADDKASNSRAAEPFAWALASVELAIRFEALPEIPLEKVQKAIGKMYRKTDKLMNAGKYKVEEAVSRFVDDLLELADYADNKVHPSHVFALTDGHDFYIKSDRLTAWFDGEVEPQYRKEALNRVVAMSPKGKDGKGTHVRHFTGDGVRYYRLSREKLAAYNNKLAVLP